MVTREVYLYLLLGHILIAGVGSNCVPYECLKCNAAGETKADTCSLCSNYTAQCVNAPSDIPSNCTKGFELSVNSTESELNEGDDLTLTCDHNLPNVTLVFGWKRNNEEIQEGKNKSVLVLKKLFSHQDGQFICLVNSSCGYYESQPHEVTVQNQMMVILIVCGVSALLLVLVLGVAVKFKLERDNAKHKERMRMKARDEQSRGPAPFTPRES